MPNWKLLEGSGPRFAAANTCRAVAASAVSREGGATSSAQKAAEELRPVLAAFAAGGGACKACVARACSQLKAKSRLKTRQAAAGLQQIILGLGGLFWGRFCLSVAPCWPVWQHKAAVSLLQRLLALLPSTLAEAANREPSPATLPAGPPAADAAADADAVAGAWLLFAEVSAQDPGAPSWRFLEEQWDAVTHQV